MYYIIFMLIYRKIQILFLFFSVTFTIKERITHAKHETHSLSIK